MRSKWGKDGYTTVNKYLGEMSERKLSRARAALRRAVKEQEDFASDACSANVVLERIWNAIIGNDLKPRKRVHSK